MSQNQYSFTILLYRIRNSIREETSEDKAEKKITGKENKMPKPRKCK